MAVNYTIEADVVDIGADTPMATDAFFVDTNVWFWSIRNSVSAYELSKLRKQCAGKGGQDLQDRTIAGRTLPQD